MGVRKVDILTVGLGLHLDEAGFRHAAAALGDRLGSQRIAASLAGDDVEPLLAPVLREPAGNRTLTAGDVVCFPSGESGAHTLQGPGRFVIFSTGTGPWMSGYLDSDKVSGPGGILLRGSAVGYWHGEGTAGP